eukprot:TRINITY_DN3074_c0_g1_i8.p1 TRINITY_DN3074_c0_g1~~TRINITY_DN3074_c0_g1_i8.p1  ORF type:complete len:155 (+),score=11.77 TRINITY_DN3074_c0_g1_i8:23-466(+)
MIRRPPRSTRKESSAASDVYKRQLFSFTIFSSRDFFVRSRTPCHGNFPFSMYIRQNPSPSKSSLRLSSQPLCAFTLQYRGVPTIRSSLLNAMCSPVSPFIYLFASPKSMAKTVVDLWPSPTRKLSGLTSRCRSCLEWSFSTLSNYVL